MKKYCCAKDPSINERYISKSSLMTTNSYGTETKCITCFYNIYFIRSLHLSIYPLNLHESTKEVFILRFKEQNGFQSDILFWNKLNIFIQALILIQKLFS